MKKITLQLPAKVYENNFHRYLENISRSVEYQYIAFDFAEVEFYIPAAWVSLLALIKKLKSEGVDVTFENLDKESDLFRYLQRIDFLKNCGLDYPENFKRREQGHRFVPIKTINRKNLHGSLSTTNTSELSSEVAKCLAPEEAQYIESSNSAEEFENYDETKTSLLDFIEYSVSELSNNVLAHSKSNGFISAQYTPTTNYVRVGIA
ncbi:MAG: hypothetical protein JJU46_04180, partial [Balneolaceae bacterium]|nr:hypothetical protein [Balneolaceae bacterium]